MGRAKLCLQLIRTEKARRLAFENRSKCLMKKAYELLTLCGVQVCMILYGPAQGNANVEPTIWPENRGVIENLIDSYKKRSDDGCRRKNTCNLTFFYKDKLKKVEKELAETHKRNMETRYPNWDESYNCLTYEELKHFSALLHAKMETVKSLIELLKEAKSATNHDQIQQSMLYYQQPSLTVPTYDPQILDFSLNQRVVMMMMAGNDGASGSNYVCNDENSFHYETGLLPFHGVEQSIFSSLPDLASMPHYLQYPLFLSHPVQVQEDNE